MSYCYESDTTATSHSRGEGFPEKTRSGLRVRLSSEVRNRLDLSVSLAGHRDSKWIACERRFSQTCSASMRRRHADDELIGMGTSGRFASCHVLTSLRKGSLVGTTSRDKCTEASVSIGWQWQKTSMRRPRQHTGSLCFHPWASGESLGTSKESRRGWRLGAQGAQARGAGASGSLTSHEGRKAKA